MDIAKICAAIGAKVEIGDPFDIAETRETLNRLMEDEEGVKVLILRRNAHSLRRREGSGNTTSAWTRPSASGRLRLQPPVHPYFPLPRPGVDTENRRAA